MHPNFVRGDKKRCLAMRSIVNKKPSTGAKRQQGDFPSGLDNAATALPVNNVLQALAGSSNSQYGINQNMMNQFQLAQLQMFASLNQGGGIMNSGNGIGFGGGGSSSMFPQGMMGGMTSADMFQAGLELERREQRQQQITNMLNNNKKDDNPFAESSSFDQVSSPPQAMGMNNDNSFDDSNNFGNNNGNGTSEITLATEIMKQSPGMEPWKALELAKRFNAKS